MKHRTWFRLALKAVGVLLIGYSVGAVFELAGMLYAILLYGEGWFFGIRFGAQNVTAVEEIIWSALYLMQMLSPLLIGLYLVFGGRWLIDKIIPLDRMYCDECGLNVSNVSGTRCPDCGTAIEGAGAASSTTAVEE